MHRAPILLLAATAAWGQTVPQSLLPLQPPPLSCGIVAPPLPAALLEAPDERAEAGLEVLSGSVSLRLGSEALFGEGIVLRDRDRLLSAEGARYDAESGSFSVTGGVEFRDPDTRIRGSSADYDTGSGAFSFRDARFELYRLPARGAADLLAVEQSGKVRLEQVSYTTCAEDQPGWQIRASRITINRDTDTASAWNARLDFLGVPILYLPYLTYPVSTQRKTGLLLPALGHSSKRGIDVEVPWYWNIAPNYDATLTPRYMSRRGVQAQAEFRYLVGADQLPTTGVLYGEFLPGDDLSGEDRSLISWFNQTSLGRGWRSTIEASNVSDSAYFEDLYSGLAASSQTHLRRRVDFELYNPVWRVLLRLEDYQTLDEALGGEDRPYKRLPELGVRARWPGRPLGLNLGLDSNITYFERNTGVTGLRARMMPEASLPLSWRGLELEPAVALDHVRYSLDDQAAGQPGSPDRTVPIYSINLRTALDRTTGRDGRWLQTLEPRVQFLHIPFRDQQDLPVFDTIEPDFNLVQLFRRNRYVGHDRYGDTSQLSMGITTRLITTADGSQFLTGSLGQTRYFRTRRVTLPDESPNDSDSSEYIGELRMNLYDRWRVNLGYQWDSGENETSLAEARVLFNPDPQRALSLAYRFRRDAVEKLDFAVAWPIRGGWSFLGRYDYSLLDRQSIERLVGFEYSTCCWGLRFAVRRNPVDRSGEADTTVTLQLQLKGLGSSASPAERLLDRGMLRYDRY